MMDEFEAHMATPEFIEDTSAEIQQTFASLWGSMAELASQQAQQAQQAQMDQNMEGIIAQTTQAAASKAANTAVELWQEQWLESIRQQMAQGVDLNQLFGQQSQGQPQ